MKHRYWIALAAAAGIGLTGCMHSADESGNSGTMRRAEAPAPDSSATKPTSGDTTSTPGTAAPDTTSDPNCTRDTTGTGTNCTPGTQTHPDTSQPSPPDTSTSPPPQAR